ncbi:bifunctional lysylphosphatidylglycerol flippase/synthetase MprF [Enterococcus casseliflavus]|uniref:bifunctional lysylphosphatidylglycerol flippase/synthetase MprF n=1 Tax=Enterococcus casseliflavus TaxID=37734 RepID=UPI00191A9469|nr:bifunctional lysylphosphatidylglycerol flippase/synthetase MprF [Enterococcus casseliflavus]QQU21183.1 bifunctional lysylphosphatidylglycerol flippase/synthetase MprF [Enterococcus casseliflavus]
MKIFTWLRDHRSLFKTLFLIAVAVIVFGELLSLSKTISIDQLKQLFAQLSLWRVALMAVIGLLCVFPMVLYDIVLNRLLGDKPDRRYLLETSWIINTMNNLIGFGGFISIGLRSEFYGKGKKGKDVAQAISKIFIYLMSGLSILSLAALAFVLFGPTTDYLQQYWIWLLGGSLYFPVVYALSFSKKNAYLGGLQRRDRLQLIAASLLEWLGVFAAFFTTGLLMGVSVDVFQLLPLFIAASVIGIVSMIPGELGTFDVMMIMGMGSLQIPRESVIAWLLLFRLFYYIIPFLIGLIFFSKNVGVSLNQRFSGIPKSLLLEVFHKIEVLLLYLTGTMLVLSATIPEAFDQIKWLAHLNPIRLNFVMQYPSIFLGYLFLIAGRGISARVSRAYVPTLLLIAATIGYAIFSGFRFSTMLFLLLLLAIMIFSKSELFRKQLVFSWEWLTIDGLLIGSLTILYVIIGVYNMPHLNRHPTHHHSMDFLLFPSEKLWLQGFVAILFVAVAMLLFARYLMGPKYQLGVSAATDKVKHVLNTYGGNSDSHLVYLKDKQVYVYPEIGEPTVFFQFTTFNNKCLVMGDPSGKQADFPQALETFLTEMDQWNYLPVFYESSEEMVMLLHEFGYDFIKFGEKAYVDLPSFTLSGKKMKGQRALNNKITKEGFTFDVLTPPFSAETFATLKEISDNWLDGRKEKGFSLGFFSESYLNTAPIAVVRNQQQEIVAFASFMPTYQTGLASIDLMRHDPEKAPNGTMDFLFIQLFDYFKEHGYQQFDLGMAPLANVGTFRSSFLQERIAYLVYTFGSRFYSFEGLREYKQKYAAAWSPRYILYSRDSWIGYVMIALLIVDNQSADKTK